MIDSELLFNTLGLASTVTASVLVLVLVYKNEKARRLQSTLNSLKKSLDEMDEQAKLIVRTDIELNKTQEELDKKINSLYALQRLSRAISTTLEENQIFKMVGATNLEELGFERACGFLWHEKESHFILRLNIGYADDEIKAIDAHVEAHKDFYLSVIRKDKPASSISLEDISFKNKISAVFKAIHFVIAVISSRERYRGFLLVGSETTDMVLNAGDEELVTILANQIAQALENAHLFEKTWQAQQELEKKVEERTRELTQVLEEVKKISRRKTDFISSVSHELRTPLTSIKGYAAILIEEKLGSLPAAVKERLEKINRHSDELVGMVNELLDIARIESGRVTMKIEKQNLQEIIASAADLIAIQFKNKNIALVTDAQKNLPFVMADRSQIERVFINLLANAIKFTPPEGRITIKASTKGEAAQIDISDTGIGMPPEALEKIFDEFYRVDNPINEQVKGTGLGLSLVKYIVEAHKGKIWVQSTPNKGSTFSFTLPLYLVK